MNKQGIVISLLFTLIFCVFTCLSSCALLGKRTSQWQQEDSQGQYSQRYNRIHRAIQTRDLVVGMNIQDVQEAWGEPQQVERSSDYDSNAERWVYVDGLSAPGYQSLNSKRVIYFEKGEVVGWERLR